MKKYLIRFKTFIFEKLPLFSLISFGIALLAALIHIFAVIFPDFADFINIHIAGAFRMILAKITGVLPVSLAELMVCALPVVIILIIVFVIHHSRKENFTLLTRFFAVAFAIVSLFYSTFVFTIGTGYHGTSLDEKLDLTRKQLSAKELEEVTKWLAENVNRYVNDVDFIADSSSVMPYSFSEMNRKLNTAYKAAADKYDFIMGYSSNVKPVMASKFLTKAGLLGMYSYYTGETNVNTDYMDYNIVFTTAHEMSHQRGISREDEANFMAFLVCLESDDPYINYCGYVNMLEYMLNPLYKALKETGSTSAYSKILNTVDGRIQAEMGVAAKKASENQGIIHDVMNKVNDLYIKAQGEKDGVASYGLVVELTAAYYYDISARNG